MWCDKQSVVVKTAQVGTESKIAHEMLCFTIETGVGGREGRRLQTGGDGLCRRYVRRSPHWQESSEVAERKAVRDILLDIIGECNCRLLTSLEK